MTQDVDIGWFSATGRRAHNEDFVAAQRAQPHEAARGLIAAVADGVSAGGRGREAAQTTVMCLLQDYFATPPTWDTSVALDRLIGAQNAWLAASNRRQVQAGGAGAMTTLTALVLRGHSYTLAHVGDTRAWLLRDAHCAQLSQDHVFDHPDMRSRLTRAIGLDDHVRLDFEQGELCVGDTFVLTSDGVHGVLRPARIAALLAGAADASGAARALVEAAVAAGSQDNASALVLRVAGLAAVEFDDLLARGRQLPLPPRLRVGDTLDRFTITAVVADTGLHRLYQARDNGTRDLVAIKALHESRGGDPQERAMLAHEVWLGLRLAEQFGGGAGQGGFVRVREVAGASAFYAVFDWHSGQTLEQMWARGERLDVPQTIAAAVAVARALGRLHRQGVVHRDIKPANLHRGDDGHWRVLDLGVAVSGREPPAQRALHAGTPSYMNPEQWQDSDEAGGGAGGAAANAQSDLFALGVTLYQWLTGHLPYGDIEPYQLARYRRDPKPPSRLRPDVPIWLDQVVLKAVARDPRQRFETAEELVLALERGASRPVGAPHSTPLIRRDPAALWKAGFAVSVLFNLLLVVWLLFLPR